MLQKFEDVPKNKKKRIIYEDEIDRIPEYEPDSPTEEEQEEDNNYEIQNKYKGKQLKQIEKPKKVKKGITKSIKCKFSVFLLFVISLIFKMQKAISNTIQLDNTLNPLDDYAGILSINDEGTLENLIRKVDKVSVF